MPLKYHGSQLESKILILLVKKHWEKEKVFKKQTTQVLEIQFTEQEETRFQKLHLYIVLEMKESQRSNIMKMKEKPGLIAIQSWRHFLKPMLVMKQIKLLLTWKKTLKDSVQQQFPNLMLFLSFCSPKQDGNWSQLVDFFPKESF